MSSQEIEIVGNEQEHDLGLGKRILNVFLAPISTFESVKRRPAWLIPAIILVLLSLGMAVMLKPVIQKDSIAQVTERMEERGASQEQIDTAVAATQRFLGISVYGGALVAPFLMFLIGAAVWLFVSNVLLGGQATFAQMLGVNVYRTFIPTLGGLIKLPIMLSKQTMNVHFSVATFLPDASQKTFLYRLLMQTDIFNIWSIAVLCIGISIVSRQEIKKVWPVVVGIYVLWYVASLGAASLIGR